MKETHTRYLDALQLTLDSLAPLDSEMVAVTATPGRVLARDLHARVDSPSVDASLKDGYAVRSADVACASPDTPVRLRLIGFVPAGGAFEGEVMPGTALRILTGARLPRGADAILSEEFARAGADWVEATKDAGPGRNILARGTDVRAGQLVAPAGGLLRPAQAGLLAAAGYSHVPVVRQPRVTIIATGDEVVAPGQALAEGQVFASNLVTLAAWCSLYGMATETRVVEDAARPIRECLLDALAGSDAILTSGGAWSGERDLVVRLLDELGWQKLYHRVKIGPGKAVAFGLWDGKPVFCLPGGPPSNQMAFLQLALPGLLRLAGHPRPGLAQVVARLGERVQGQRNWTQFVEGRFEAVGSEVVFQPLKLDSRLSAMAGAEGVLAIPEGVEVIPRGARVLVQVVPGALPAAGLAAPALPAVVSFVARSGMGKTSFLEKLIPELKSRGLRVGVLKHHAHATPFDVPGKDTYRLSAAGADVVVGACSVQLAVFHQEDGAADLEGLIGRQFEGVDLVLAEGFKQRHFPKIELHRAAHPRSGAMLCEPGELLAVVTDVSLDVAAPQFDLEDAPGVADFLLAWLAGGGATLPAGERARP